MIFYFGSRPPERHTFKMKIRKLLKITSRTSTITNSFVQAIIPEIKPTAAEVTEALDLLGMSISQMSCVYCGTAVTDWDHLRPLVRGKRPTGYISEIRNLVPSCGPCNQSKSGSDWRAWMQGAAPGSPRTKGVSDIATRIEKLERFELWGNVKALPLRELAGVADWDAHWANLEAIELRMQAAQSLAAKIKAAIINRMNVSRSQLYERVSPSVSADEPGSIEWIAVRLK